MQLSNIAPSAMDPKSTAARGISHPPGAEIIEKPDGNKWALSSIGQRYLSYGVIGFTWVCDLLCGRNIKNNLGCRYHSGKAINYYTMGSVDL